jgi:hypothetical protein
MQRCSVLVYPQLASWTLERNRHPSHVWMRAWSIATQGQLSPHCAHPIVADMNQDESRIWRGRYHDSSDRYASKVVLPLPRARPRQITRVADDGQLENPNMYPCRGELVITVCGLNEANMHIASCGEYILGFLRTEREGIDTEIHVSDI